MSGFLSSKFLKYQDPERPAPTGPSDDDILLAGGAGARRIWRTGFAIAFVCLLGVVAARLTQVVSAVWGIGDVTVRMYLNCGLVLSVLWLIAAWLITPAVLGRRFMFMGTMGWVVRVSQLLWPAGYACWMLGIAAADDRLIMWGRVLRLGAGAGAILLAVMLIAVAGAAQREKAARRFNEFAGRRKHSLNRPIVPILIHCCRDRCRETSSAGLLSHGRGF